MSTLGDLLAEHTVLPGNAVDHLHAVVGRVAAAGRPVLRRLSDVGAPRRRRAGVRRAGAAQHRADGAAGRRRRHPERGRRDAVGDRRVQLRRHRQAKPSGTTGFTRSQRGGCSRALQQRRGRGADAPDRAGRTQRQPAGERLPRLRGRPAATCCPKAPSPMSATWRCRGRARASATASSASTGPASSPSPAPTRSRPITGWAWRPSWRATTSSRSPVR